MLVIVRCVLDVAFVGFTDLCTAYYRSLGTDAEHASMRRSFSTLTIPPSSRRRRPSPSRASTPTCARQHSTFPSALDALLACPPSSSTSSPSTSPFSTTLPTLSTSLNPTPSTPSIAPSPPCYRAHPTSTVRSLLRIINPWLTSELDFSKPPRQRCRRFQRRPTRRARCPRRPLRSRAHRASMVRSPATFLLASC